MSKVSDKSKNSFEIDELKFEHLLLELASRFVNVALEDIDKEINESLKKICDFLDFDLAVLWQINKKNPEEAILTHFYRRCSGPEIQIKMSAKKSFPWTLQKMLNKETIKFANTSQYPEEAETDIQTRKKLNLKSTLAIPLYLGENPVLGVLTFNTYKIEIEWQEKLVNKLQFIAQVLTNALYRKQTEKIILDNLKFEKLLSVLTARFINIEPENVDNEINDSLKQICDFLGFDISSLWYINKENPLEAYLAHYYRRYEGQEIPDKMEAGKTFPFTLQKALNKEIVKYKNISDLPPEAALEIETRRKLEIVSALVFPLYTGRDPVFGIITFNTMREEFDWTEDIIIKLQFISQVFANAIARKNNEQLLRENNERLRLASAYAGTGFWDLILETKQVWINENARNLYGFKKDKIFYLDDFIERIHPDDRNQVKKNIEDSLKTGKYTSEHRIILPDGKKYWVLGRGSIFYNKEQKPERLIGVSVDITSIKDFQQSLKNSEELKSSILDSIISQILVLDSNGNILYVNKAWKKFTAENKDLGKEFFVSPGDNYLAVLENSVKSESKFLFKHLRGIKSVMNRKSLKYKSQYSVITGSKEFWFMMHFLPLENEKNNYILINFDITELKKTQKTLEKTLLELTTIKEQLHKDNIYLKEEIKLNTNFENIIGSSDAIKYCLFNVEKVASLNTTVLIQGETGTGKELIARAIHYASSRSNRPLIKVDCSTLPPSIIESELFGREQGAYTDAKA